MPIDAQPTPLTFAVARDEDAARVAPMLIALGYDPVRVVDADHGRPAREVALERLVKRYRLNEREALIAGAIVRSPTAPTLEFLADAILQSTQTAQWVRHCVLTKVGCADSFAFVALVLSLCDAQAAPTGSETAQESQTPAVGARPSKTWV